MADRPGRQDAADAGPGAARRRRLGVIKITEEAEVTIGLELVEGIESGLALLTAARRQGYMPPPIWAAVNAGAFSKFPALAAIEVLTLHHDNDPAGREAARK